MSDYFALLGMSPAFELDLALLADNYRQAAREVHPDRFASADARSQRQAVEQAAELNQAYSTLKSTTARALYLLNLQAALAEEATVQDPEFLFQQMEWREELEDLEQGQDIAAIDAFSQRLTQARNQINTAFAAIWNDQAQRTQAERLVRRMQFLDKVLFELDQLEERLDDF